MRLKTTALYTSLVLIMGLSHSAWAVQDKSPWSTNARISFTSDDNISQAEQDSDIAEDQSAELSASLAFSRLLTLKQGYTIAGFTKFKGHREFSTLDSSSLGVTAIYRIQPQLGFTQPLYQLSATLKAEEFDFDQRDSTTIELRAQIKKRITDKLALAIGGEHQSTESDGTVFDLERTKFFTNFDLSLNSAALIYFNYSYIDGDSVSTGFANNQPFRVINAQEASEPDLAFSELLTGAWIAYRLSAKTNTYKLGYNRRISPSMSIDLSVLMADVEARGDNNYQRLLGRLSIAKRF